MIEVKRFSQNQIRVDNGYQCQNHGHQDSNQQEIRWKSCPLDFGWEIALLYPHHHARKGISLWMTVSQPRQTINSAIAARAVFENVGYCWKDMYLCIVMMAPNTENH